MNRQIQMHHAQKGITIIQVMAILLLAGIIGALIVNFIIDKRCESDASSALCIKRAGSR